MSSGNYAENVNYWQTSRSSDQAIETAKREIKKAGGEILQDGFMHSYGRSAWMLEFKIADAVYRCVWPVLKSKTGNEKAARIQAAVAMKHDIKAKCVSAKWLGVEQAFARERLLQSGQTVGDVVGENMLAAIPQLFLGVGEEVES